MDAGLLRYLPAMFPLVYQEIIYAVRTKKKQKLSADSTNKRCSNFNIKFSANKHKLEQCSYLSSNKNKK